MAGGFARTLVEFRLKHAQSDQIETIVYANRNVGNLNVKKKTPNSRPTF
jgi:hypothetical protein